MKRRGNNEDLDGGVDCFCRCVFCVVALFVLVYKTLVLSFEQKSNVLLMDIKQKHLESYIPSKEELDRFFFRLLRMGEVFPLAKTQ